MLFPEILVLNMNASVYASFLSAVSEKITSGLLKVLGGVSITEFA